MAKKEWSVVKLTGIVRALPKSSRAAGDAVEAGPYPFFVSGQQVKACDSPDHLHSKAVVLATGGSPAVHRAEGSFSFSTDCWALVATPAAHPSFLYYLLASKKEALAELGFRGAGIKHLDKDWLLNTAVAVPSRDEQAKIAHHLDAKTAAIDVLITKKELLIEELKKYTQAVVTETVLRGLNPTAQLAPSRAPDMGLIPRHWQVAKTSKVLRYVKGVAVPKEDLATEGDPAHRFLRTGDFWNVNGHEKDQVFVVKTDGLVRKEEGELVACFDGFNSVAGKGTVGMARFDGAGYLDSMLCLVKEKEGRSHRRFLEYLHVSSYMENQIVVAARGTTAMHAGYAQYDILVPVPPLDEQKDIADALDARLAPLRPIAESALDQIRELRLLRASLISEAVTGKLQLPN